MLSDCHVHTEFSGDSAAPARDQIERALCLRMNAVCITDHHDYDVSSPIDFTLDFDRYFPAMRRLKEEYEGRIDVRTGVELGLQAHLADYTDRLVRSYPFDYVIGSVHFIDGMDPYFPEYFGQRGERRGYEEYFETLLQNITLHHSYDAAGHLDYIVRYGPNKNLFYNYDRYREILDAILEVIVKNGKGIECNSAGYRKGLGQPNPHRDVILRYREMGGEIVTVGSDAHTPGEIGADFDRMAELLKSCGFRYYAAYKERKPEFHRL